MTAKKKRPKKKTAKRAAKKAARRTSKKAAKKARAAKRRPALGVDLVAIRRAALALPGVEEGTSYGTPAFRVKKKLILRLHQGGDDLVVRLDDDLCEMRMAAEPDVFHETPHYEGHPYVLARLAAMSESRLVDLVEEAWELVASPGLVESRRG